MLFTWAGDGEMQQRIMSMEGVVNFLQYLPSNSKILFIVDQMKILEPSGNNWNDNKNEEDLPEWI
jgi:hypothetical protein